jgi:Na+-translocating ferredoxin:NAD+ oxidoreductase RNF subunit RnfB
LATRVTYCEQVAAKCPPGTQAKLQEIGLALGKKPTEIVREAILAVVRQSEALPK